jgi:hypothetical protein
MAKIKVVSKMSHSGPPTFPIFGSVGGSFVKCSKLQLCNFRELMHLMKKEGESMNEKDQYFLYKRLMEFSSVLDKEDFQTIEHTLGFCNDQGGPERCWNCGGKNFRETHHHMEHVVCEIDVYCSDCEKMLGNWAYGAWSP